MLSLKMICAIDNQAGSPNMVNKHRKGHLFLANDKPKLPDILFNMICKPEPQAPTENEPHAPYDNNMVRQLCERISINQFGNYSTWIQLGMTLKNIEAPLELWEELSKKNKNIKKYECKTRWFMLIGNKYTVGSLRYRAKIW